MINKLKNIFKAYMIRPLIYKVLTKSSIILVICLLWNKFVNTSNVRSLTEDAFFVIGLIWVLFAWFQYLKLDGYTFQYVFRGKQKEKKKHMQKDMVDFVDEEIVSFDELEDEEKVVVNMFSNLITGMIYVLISIVCILL